MSSPSGSSSKAISNGAGQRVERCDCGIPVARFVSWTETNPGRKFVKCKFYSGRFDGLGCSYWRWTDYGVLEWQRIVTNQLLAENRALRSEVANYRDMLQARDVGVGTEVQMVGGGVNQASQAPMVGSGVNQASQAQLVGGGLMWYMVVAIVVGVVLGRLLG